MIHAGPCRKVAPMQSLPRSLAAFLIVCCALAACGSDKPATTPTTSGSPSVDSSAATQPAGAGGTVDCAALKIALADLLVNWQVVIGFANIPTSQWSATPIGSISKLGDQLATLTAVLGDDTDAATSLTFMKGANDIVARGIGGDVNAQTDLAKYLQIDVDLSIALTKQIPISTAYEKIGCR